MSGDSYMAGKNTAAYGLYSDRVQVEEAIDAFVKARFRPEDISVLFPDNQGTKDFAHEKNTKAPEGGATGVVAGGIAGGVLGWLTGIGLLAIPGLGPFLAAGPIVAALAGAGAVGTLGGIIGALIGLGIPEYEARRYEGRIRDGGILLSVHCDNSDWVRRAKDVLQQTGAQDIASSGEKAGDFANADKPMPRVRSVGSVAPIEPVPPVAPVGPVTTATSTPLSSEETLVGTRPLRRRLSDIDLDDAE